MIIVTGTPRSGTSMWMQILIAAGYPPIGEKFPRNWGESLREANTDGFWESSLRDGINYTTNPDPRTGEYVRPGDVTHNSVKVFIRGLVRTDLAYMDHVLVTAREWRAHADSVRRLWQLEDAERPGPAPPRLDPVVEWFVHNFTLLADMTRRGYPVRICTFEDVLADPRAAIAPVLGWIGGGDLDAAVAAVEARVVPARRDEHRFSAACDVLFTALRTGVPPGTGGQAELARAHAAMMPELTRHEDSLASFQSRAPAQTVES